MSPGPIPAPGSGPSRAVGAPTAIAPAPDAPTKPDLTVNKILAGAGAAAVSAILGSFFGALGTVAGAALGSVVSTLATTVLQHSLDRTRDRVRARIKLSGGRTLDVEGKVEVPAPPVAPGGETGQARVYVTPADQPTTVLSPAAVPAQARPRSRSRLLVLTGITVVVFALGMLAVTGIELVKGSPLNTSGNSGSGTSVGRVLGSSSGSASSETKTTETSRARATTSTTETASPTEEPTTEPRSTEEPSATPAPGLGGAEVPEPDADTTPTPSAPRRAASGGGAADTASQ